MAQAELTTLQKVKDRLQITSSGHDSVLQDFIKIASAYIERYTGRKFEQADYTELVPTHEGQKLIYVQNPPIVALTSVEARKGTLSNPQWEALPDVEIMQEGNAEAWAVRIYGGTPGGVNELRINYKGGYLIDFQNESDPQKHTLPPDITAVATELVAMMYKTRHAAGKSRETAENYTIDYLRELDGIYKEILDSYARPAIGY